MITTNAKHSMPLIINIERKTASDFQFIGSSYEMNTSYLVIQGGEIYSN